MVKVLFWSPNGFARDATLDALERIESAEVELVETLDDCAQRVVEADILVLGDAAPSEAQRVVSAIGQPGSRLRAMHFISAGREGFDTVGIPDSVIVTGPVGAVAPTVAEHAVALVLALVRQVPAISANTHRGAWDRSIIRNLRSLEGQTALIVGLGHIGRQVAVRLHSFGMCTIGLQRHPRQDGAVDELGRIADLESFLPRADLVIISAALAAETAGLFDAARLGMLKPTALLVNVARGGIVDTEALAVALHDGELAGAAVDVTDPEPLPEGHALWSAPNTLISPHLAGGGSAASVARIGLSVADRVRELREPQEDEAHV